MLFTETASDRKYERMMTRIPNFRSRGGGRRIGETDLENARLIISNASVKIGKSTYREKIKLTVREEKARRSEKRKENLFGKKGYEMDFKNKRHKEIFVTTAARLEKNNSLLAAVYLLTASGRLWADAEPCISRNSIDFDSIKRGKHSIGAYALFCAAKDLYLGTESMNIADMSDRSVIPDVAFGLICNAMMIKRYGLKALDSINVSDEALSETEKPNTANCEGGRYAEKEAETA